jgi:Uma2 family endonuclease
MVIALKYNTIVHIRLHEYHSLFFLSSTFENGFQYDDSIIADCARSKYKSCQKFDNSLICSQSTAGIGPRKESGMIVSQPKIVITPEAYLVTERQSEIKSEYFYGEMFAMADISRKHNIILTNVVRMIGNQLMDRPCNVYSSDMKVKIEKLEKYSYPDIVISCEEERFADEHEDVLLTPWVIAEILSDSTEAYDRGLKFAHFQCIPSFKEYVLISQRFCRVEKYLRQNDTTWLYCEYHDLNDIIPIEMIQCELSVKDIYAKIEFNETENLLR